MSLKLAAQNHFEHPRPRIRGEKRQGFAFVCGFGRRCTATRKQQAAVANGEEFGGCFSGGDSDGVRIGAEGSLVEVGEIAYTGGKIGADRQ